jgi:hypothetical protein
MAWAATWAIVHHTTKAIYPLIPVDFSRCSLEEGTAIEGGKKCLSVMIP